MHIYISGEKVKQAVLQTALVYLSLQTTVYSYHRVKARIGLVEKKASGGDEEPSEEPVVTHILEKSKKVLSTGTV